MSTTNQSSDKFASVSPDASNCVCCYEDMHSESLSRKSETDELLCCLLYAIYGSLFPQPLH
jgi:hypothetical protein